LYLGTDPVYLNRPGAPLYSTGGNGRGCGAPTSRPLRNVHSLFGVPIHTNHIAGTLADRAQFRHTHSTAHAYKSNLAYYNPATCNFIWDTHEISPFPMSLHQRDQTCRIPTPQYPLNGESIIMWATQKTSLSSLPPLPCPLPHSVRQSVCLIADHGLAGQTTGSASTR
jgi:hypothetical protein